MVYINNNWSSGINVHASYEALHYLAQLDWVDHAALPYQGAHHAGNLHMLASGTM
jgi:hypothetical protein